MLGLPALSTLCVPGSALTSSLQPADGGMPDTTLHYTKWGGVRVDNVLVTETGLRGKMSEAALSNFFAEFNSTEPCAPAVKVAGGVKLRYCLCDETHVAKTEERSVALHPDCWGTLQVQAELGPTDIENYKKYTPTERALIVAYAAYPNFAEELNEIVLPSFDTMAEIRGQYPQEQFNFSFLASTVNFNNDDAPIPTLAPTLAKLQLVAETTSWHDLHGTRVKTVFTGNAAPPPMDMYSWYRIATNATLVNECKARLERSHKYIVDGLAKQQNVSLGASTPTKQSAEGLAKPRVLWLLRDTDRSIINQDDVVQTMREAGASAITLRKAAHVPLQTLVSDFQNHEIVFAVHGADMANTVHGPAIEVKRQVTVQLMPCGSPGGLDDPLAQRSIISNSKNREYTASYVSLWTIAHGQPYIEAYTDDFRSCDGVDFRDNFTISTGDRLKKLFELAVQTFNGNRTGLMKFMPASFDEGSLWFQQAHKLSETCQAECYTNTLIWGVKCGWSKTCAGCDECGGASTGTALKPAGSNASATGVPEGFTPTATCQTECHTYAGDWTVKCKWKDRVNCDGCEECFWRAGGSDSCQANCYTSVVQDWKEKCKWNDRMHCIGCAECGPNASNTQQPQPQQQAHKLSETCQA